MRLLKLAGVLCMAIASISVAQAGAFYNVPFKNVEVNAASKIYVNYNFDAHKQTLVCTSEQANETITSVEWSYKDATRKLELPITLKDDSRFDGYFADPDGMLIITNDFGSSSQSGSIFVTCEYRKMA